MFRNQMPDEWLASTVQLLSPFIASPSHVVSTYACCAIEKILLRRGADGLPIVKKEQLRDIIIPLLENISALLKKSLNYYALRALYRIVSTAQEEFNVFALNFASIVPAYVEMAFAERHNAHSLYILFETLGLIIRNNRGHTNVLDKYEQELMPSFEKAFSGNVTEMLGYVFQVFAAFVMASDCEEVKHSYSTLFNSMLQNEENWKVDMKYLVPSMVRFVCALCYRFPAYVHSGLQSLMSIYDHVLKNLHLEDEAMLLLSALVETMPISDASVFEILKSALQSAFQVLSFYKHETRRKIIPFRFLRSTFHFLAKVSIRHGPEMTQLICDKVQQGMMIGLLNSEIESMRRMNYPPRDRRKLVIGFTKMLFAGVIEPQSELGFKCIANLIDLLTGRGGGYIQLLDDQGGDEEFQDDARSLNRIQFQPLHSCYIDVRSVA